jgi:hypothetical protein
MPHRERREIEIVNADHDEALRALFMACRGRLYGFDLRGTQSRFDSDKYSAGSPRDRLSTKEAKNPPA